MTDLATKVEQARGQLQVDWNPERARQAERGVHRRRRRRAAVRTGAALVGLVLVAASTVALQRVLHPAEVADARVMRFEDGSVATLQDGATVTRTSNEPHRTLVEIVKGGARFEVTRNPARVFRVEAGQVAVEVLGTRFSVERHEGSARVTVQSGRVRVISAAGTVELTSGQSGEYQEGPAPEVEADEVPTPDAKPRKTWKALAHRGDYDKAWQAMRRSQVDEESSELFLAADVARLSRHPAEAVEPLRKVMKHPSDPRAPLAAFTLGRVLLEDLGRPRDAAKAFAEATALSPSGPLAEDALAREVEAWSRAGDEVKARDRALLYAKRFPAGLRLKAVRRFGGLE